MAETGNLAISVAFSPVQRKIVLIDLHVPAGTTLEALLLHLAVQKSLSASQLDMSELVASVWGQKSSKARVLQDHDRVELSRALRVDPKVARRERFQKQGARTTGLFARQRPGSKQGY